MPLKNTLSPKILVFAWLIAAGAGSWLFVSKSFTPGETGAAPSDWPASSAVVQNKGHFTLVVALHPECACSQATLENLAALLPECQGQLSAEVICVDYPDLEQRAVASGNWKRAGQIAGVTLILDPNAVEAKRFGARTSGESRLYGPTGRLLFRGGITAGRGHAGLNPGSTAVIDLVKGRTVPGGPSVAAVAGRPQAPSPATTPVFGCSL